MAHLKKPFQLLEINIISAQDLHHVSRRMKTYATAWVHPKRKLSTSVDTQGNNSPTWNDKFVFRVDEEFLRRDTSAVMIEIYAAHWFRDTLVGTVRVIVGNLIPPATRSNHHNHHSPFGMRFAALQVRRPSGRPQGIINIGVGVLDSSMRSMPLYTQLSASAVGYRDLMAEDTLLNSTTTNNHQNMINQQTIKTPLLRRARSERSDLVVIDDLSSTNGSVFTIPPHKKGGSVLSSNNGSVFTVPNKGKASPSLLSSGGSESSGDRKSKKGKKKKKASSVISGGAEFREKPPKDKAKKGKASSLLGSIISKDSHHKSKEEKPNKSPPKESPIAGADEKVKDDAITNNKVEENASLVKKPGSWVGPPAKETPPMSVRKHNGPGLFLGGPRGSSIVNGKYIFAGPPKGAHSFWSDSEVGPSPSEVAAAVAAQNTKYPFDDNGSSVLDGWSLDESVEGLRSKLERWRTELPPLYDRGGYGSSGFRSTSQHIRRQSEGGTGGLFSCFGNVYGYECQCVCGKPPEGRNLSGRFQSPSASAGRSFT